MDNNLQLELLPEYSKDPFTSCQSFLHRFPSSPDILPTLTPVFLTPVKSTPVDSTPVKSTPVHCTTVDLTTVKIVPDCQPRVIVLEGASG
jgi:hypothetical protein